MENSQAIEILVQVANLAQEKGLLKLNDAVLVYQAIEVLTSKPEVQEN